MWRMLSVRMGLFVGVALGAGAAELSVPGDHGSIQAAISAAASGDTVLVGPGTYNECLILKDGVSLIGEGAAEVKVVCDATMGPALSVGDCATGTVRGIAFDHVTLEGDNGPCEGDAEDRAVVVIESSGITFTECTVKGGAGTGLLVSGIGSPTASMCEISNNGLSGVLVSGHFAEPVIVDSKCCSNGTDGMSFVKGAQGDVRGNTCSENERHGISCVNGRTSPDLKENTCDGNGGDGIYIGEFCSGLVSLNSCNGNRGSGVCVDAVNASPELRNNTCLDNRRFGIYYTPGTKAQAEGNVYNRNAVFCKEEICRLWAKKRFDELEQIASRLRTDKTRFASGEWQLGFFYEYLTEGFGDLTAAKGDDYLAVFEEWGKAYPDSITQRVALASAHATLAWEVRGSGMASEVTEDGWRGFRKHLEKAWSILTEAEEMKQKDPELYAAMVTVAMGQNRDDGGVTGYVMKRLIGWSGETEMDRVFGHGIRLEPGYLPIYRNRVTGLLPRWGGSPRAMVKFAERAADYTKEQYGDSLYAYVASEALRWEGRKSFAEDYGFSWERIKRGYLDFLQAHPESSYRLNDFCEFACIQKDKKTAKALFDLMGGNHDNTVWQTTPRFSHYRKWASGEEEYPGVPELNDAIERLDVGQAAGLLEKGVDVNATDEYGVAPLHIAIRKKNERAVNLLLMNKADPNLLDKEGTPPVYVAVWHKHVGIAGALMDHGADATATKDGWTPLRLSVYLDTVDMTRMLLEKGVDANEPGIDGWSALHTASSRGNVEMVAALLERGADPNALNDSRWSVLEEAAKQGKLEVVRMLLEKGAEIGYAEPDGWTAVHMATENDDTEVLTLLLDRDPGCIGLRTRDSDTLLHNAAAEGKKEAVELLLARGAEVNPLNNKGQTPLARAAENGHDDVAELLREHGGR